MRISKKQAEAVGKKLGIDFAVCDLEEFRKGMEVEFEHKDVIGNSKLKAGMIAHAHLMEVPNYYTLLKRYVEK